MGRPSKATKKFNRTRLRTELANRKKHKDSSKHLVARQKAAAKNAKSPAAAGDDDNDHGAADAAARVGRSENSLGFGDDDDDDEEDGDDGEHAIPDSDDELALDPFANKSSGKSSDDDSSDNDDGADMSDDNQDSDDDIEHMNEHDLEDDQELSGDDTADEFSMHKSQLQELSKRDPEFYQYLKENDSGLLEFDGADDDDDENTNSRHNDDSDDQGDDESDHADDDQEEDGRHLVTMDMVREWRAAVSTHQSIRTVRKILLAYRAASANSDMDDDAEKYSHKIDDERVFNRVVLLALRHAPLAFNKALYGGGDASTATAAPAGEENKTRKVLPSATKKWRRIQPLVKSFLSSSLKLMGKMTDRGMLATLLKQSEAAVVYYACFPKLCKDLIAHLVGFWSSAEEEQIRILAFLCLRRLAIAAPNPHLQTIAKKSYSAYLETVRKTNVHTWTHITFMANCMVELCGIHLPTTYQLVFVYIRQMAIQLRNAMTTRTKESHQGVYTWPFVHSMRVWSMVLGVYCDASLHSSKDVGVLTPLVYPLVQVAIGAIRLKPSSRFFPFHLHLIRLLIDLMKRTGVFIPVSSYLFDMFRSAEFTNNAKPSTQKPIDFALTIKAPNAYLGTRVYRKSLVDETVHALYDYYATMSRSVSFPELTIPAIVEMRSLVKRSRDMHMNRQLQGLVEKLEQNSRFVESKRSGLEYGPKDIDRVKEFMGDVGVDETPLCKFNVARNKMRERQKPVDAIVPEDDEDDRDDGEVGSGVEEDDEDDDGGVVVKGKGKKVRKGDGEDGRGGEPRRKKSKSATSDTKMQQRDRAGDGDEDDVVEDFVLSDDE